MESISRRPRASPQFSFDQLRRTRLIPWAWSMRTADTVFEINSIPEVQSGAFASDDKGVLPIYLTGVAEAYSLRILALDEHGSVMSSSNACI